MPKSDNPFRWFDSSPEVIQMVVMLYVRFPLSLRNVGLMGWTAPATADVNSEGASHRAGGPTMQLTTIGFDLGKNVFQVHGVTADGQVIVLTCAADRYSGVSTAHTVELSVS